MDGINKNPNNFRVSEIQQRNTFNQMQTPKKKPGGLISMFSKKNLPKTLLIIIVVFILIATGAIIWGRNSFSKSKVELSIETADDIASGKEATIVVSYKNQNRVDLEDARLIIDYPSGTYNLEGEEIFQEQRDLGTISKKSEGEQEFKVRFIGSESDIKNLNAKLNYMPQNINSRFENTASLRTEIEEVLVQIDIDGTEKAISGQEVSYVIEYENKSDEDLSDLRMEVEYSDDFEISEANPEPIEDEDGVWEISKLNSGEKGKLELKGKILGNEGESKILKVVIGKQKNGTFLQYSKEEFNTQMSPSPLLLSINMDGDSENCNIDTGQKMNYELEFKNNTEVALEQLVLTLQFDSSVFDFDDIDLNGKGYFDSRENTITWSGGEVSELKLLEPNDSGSVSFSIKVKDNLSILTSFDKNFKAIVSAEISTLSIPSNFSVSELKIEQKHSCKINTELYLEVEGYYYEPNDGIINTGPIPPEVDESTNYTIHWQIVNTSNDLENVQVKAILPQGIVWSNYYINKVDGSSVYYNERTKEIVWEIDYVVAGAGVNSAAYELIFQIGLTPSTNQVGTTPTLINQTYIEATDSFTETNLSDSVSSINTSLPDDSDIGTNDGRVIN